MLPTLITTLRNMRRGQKVRVTKLAGSRPTCSRLCSLGITPGTEIEICRADHGNDCVLVRVRNASLVLGNEMPDAVQCVQVCATDEKESYSQLISGLAP